MFLIGHFTGKGYQTVNHIRSKTLFILDGVESVQGSGGNADSIIMDDIVRMIICSLAEYNPGLCVITTRKHITELDKYEGITCKTYFLKNLDYDSSTALLKKMGTYGAEILVNLNYLKKIR